MQIGITCEAVKTPKARPARSFDCVMCAAPFQSRQSKATYCPACCGPARIAKAHATRTANAMARRRRTCEHCGAAFTMRNPSGAARPGKANEGKYCSRACAIIKCSEDRRIYASEHEAQLAQRQRRMTWLGILPVPDAKPCTICGVFFKPKSRQSKVCSARCQNALQYPRDRSARPCRDCGKVFAPLPGDGRIGFCTVSCGNRFRHRVSRMLRDARKRGVEAESVNPLKVFEPDGWRCHICHERTPRRLRGTIDPSAPELDHIVPLSAGGAHSYVNTACACRRCNSAKGARIFGQLRLFG
jgi:5-methylcytosine-specific restriction endonuclease McrA